MSGLATTGSVGSRFVSQNELDEAKKNKEEAWKAAYARIGQEPPPMQEEAEYDPRSLYEKLQTNKDTKREQWDEKMKMSNQFRGLEEDEIRFLSDEKNKEEEEERKRKQAEEEVLKKFRSATAAKKDIGPPPSLTVPASSTSSTTKPVAAPAKPKPKKGIPGLVLKKKPSPPSTPMPPAKAENKVSAKRAAEESPTVDDSKKAKMK